MRPRSSHTLFLLVICLAPAALWADDFRNSSWGDTMEAVKSSETAPFHHERADELAFTDSSIEGIDGGIIYLFEHGRLVRAVYVSRNEYSGGEGVLEDYQRMSARFGELLDVEGVEERRWLDDSPGDRSDSLDAALVAGRVRVTTSWTVGRTQVDLIMTGQDGGVFLRALFQPRS